MMRSLYSGVSGLKTHQVKMDVVGNNIANVNTVAYKSSSITFSDLLSQTTQKASGANAATGTGGTNARQIGLGVKSGAINMNISGQGASQSTGNPFDLMITGSAFFVVSDGRQNFFTRDGSFYVDGAGNLAMTSTGYNVMGWGVDAATGEIKKDNVSALRIMNTANMTYPPEATTQAVIDGILDRNDAEVASAGGRIANLNFYDSLGYRYTAKFSFKQSDDPSEYSVELDRLLDSDGNEVDISGATFGTAGRTQAQARQITFDSAAYQWDDRQLQATDGTVLADLSVMVSNGALETDLSAVVYDPDTGTDGDEITMGMALDNIAKAHGYEGATQDFLNLYCDSGSGPVSFADLLANKAVSSGTDEFPLLGGTNPVSFEAQGRFFDGTTVTFSDADGSFTGLGGAANQVSTVLGLSGIGANFGDITIDFSGTSNVNNKGTSTIGATSGGPDGLGTGRQLGTMIGVAIQTNGEIYASYDNGMTKLLGQIAVAEFANASGLEKSGNNLYSATLNSGEFDGVGTDVTASGGSMNSGQLEMSNVDLSSEFTEMITTQRGFQANSRIITVSDTLLEELTNLKR
ncbi:MAG: flagellar hook-basal body complex protein [Clostridium sp.]|jgi:flagellar hook protein FlgE|nr:flagellar hook-basal body complex protein [Clostridium sp.]